MIIQVPSQGMGRRMSAHRGSLVRRKGYLHCNLKCYSMFFFFINSVFMVSGIIIAYIWILTTVRDLPVGDMAILDDKIQRTSWLMLTVGGILFVTGIVGCWGAALGNRCLLYMFDLNVMVMIMIEMGTFAFFYFGKKDLVSGLSLAVEKELLLYGDKSSMDTKDFVDTYQKFYGCCGAESGDDFKKTPWYARRRDTSVRVPESCCAYNTACQKGNIHKDNPYTGTGCVVAIQNYLYKNGAVIMGGLTTIIWFQLISVCVAQCIVKAYSDMEEALDNQMMQLYSTM